jgi:hypothetical protein
VRIITWFFLQQHIELPGPVLDGQSDAEIVPVLRLQFRKISSLFIVYSKFVNAVQNLK